MALNENLTSISNKRFALVIVRAGDKSLHPKWVDDANTNRLFDLHISYYGNRKYPFSDRPDDISLSFEPGTKSQGLAQCLQKLGEIVNKYEYIWLPDDDILTDQNTINSFLAIVRDYKLDVSQPALGLGSYIAHDITVQRPDLKLRYTTFVEVMAPCFSRAALRQIEPYLGATASSWGVDHLFGAILNYPQDRIAIVDQTPVIHTRPVGGPNIQRAEQLGPTAREEMERLLFDMHINIRIENLSAIDLREKTLSANEIRFYSKVKVVNKSLTLKILHRFSHCKKQVIKILSLGINSKIR
jgi:hypothetical protein